MTAPTYPLYQRLPGLILAFHGCDKAIGEKLLQGKMTHLQPSKNNYDWLGGGIYFWENDPLRAWSFAEKASHKHHLTKGSIKTPFVLGAIIDLGLCLNLMDCRALDEVRYAHDILQLSYVGSEEIVPMNTGENLGARFLDRAVIEMLHTLRLQFEEKGGMHPPYDTVRSAFPEGNALYENAGFQAENHIQIAVRNHDCIKGYFRPIQE
ncbi:hypothetical protein HC248_00049 [Polaromonas vacuolata]|uniref:DUF3990 domain-containing protein n=1 Tax=Polaromonas vacuolata TaxID=37448 RepID=A0A6H2H4U0_9BURK|nr:hypothetical protein [Polaromonas vacuolata]QJC54787.1 hypothetical protein HC248_00049 [Polaromonas vacuolata]